MSHFACCRIGKRNRISAVVSHWASEGKSFSGTISRFASSQNWSLTSRTGAGTFAQSSSSRFTRPSSAGGRSGSARRARSFFRLSLSQRRAFGMWPTESRMYRAPAALIASARASDVRLAFSASFSETTSKATRSSRYRDENNKATEWPPQSAEISRRYA